MNALNNAKTKKNDEWFTIKEDVEKEMFNYESQFYGKVVYCNCDDYEHSSFFDFFLENFTRLGLKRLICSSYRQGGHGIVCVVSGENDLAVRHLTGDGSFASDECIEILKHSDIVVSNPPFSLFREYIQILVGSGKGFLVIGNLNAVACKDIFRCYKNNEVWFGYNQVKRFLSPEGAEKRFGNICWYTNLSRKDNAEMRPIRDYDPLLYPRYYNYDAIEVSRASEIPKGYNGCMGVPISFLLKINREQFEVIECCEPALELTYYKRFPCFKGEYASRQVVIGGKRCQKVYHRVLLRLRDVHDER